MPTIYLVRHGNAAGGFDESIDPGLDDLGHSQASAMAENLAPKGPFALVSSPLQRAREIAEPLARAWGAAAAIEPRVTEIPSPTAVPAERGAWLKRVMDKQWDELGDALADWRQGILDALASLEEDTVIVTHFMVINIAAGAALNDKRLVTLRPDNCSVNVFESAGAGLRLISRGKELETKVG